MSTLTIKYLDSYPVYDFFETVNLPEAIFEGYFEEETKTDRKWGHVYDDNKQNRTIQTIRYEKYAIYDVVAKNIDLLRLQSANHVSVQTDTGDVFVAVNFTVEYTDKEFNRDSEVTVKFLKQVETSQQLSSEFAESLHSDIATNRISFTVVNAPYVQNTSMVWNGSTYTFQFTVNDLTDNISVDDYYYCHVRSTSFDNETHYYCKCTAKTATDLTFTSQGVGASTAVTNIEVILDHEPEFASTGNVINITSTFNIYTFVEPYFSNMFENTEVINLRDDTKIYGKTIASDLAHMKIWLTSDELYKVKYLNFASTIAIYFASYSFDVYPTTKDAILSQVQKDTLIDLYEYDLNVKYNHLSVNNNRVSSF